MPRDEELIEIACTLVHETDAAWLIDTGDKEAWAPKSRCSLEKEGRGYTLTCPMWMAHKEGWI